MNSELREHLNGFYVSLQTQLRLKRKLMKDSILVSILNIKSNEAFTLLSTSGVKPVIVPRDAFDSLVTGGFIRMAERPDKYVITVKGVWEIESEKGAIGSDLLLEELDRKFFDLFKEGGKLTEKEKVILLAMVAVRAFASESALDLKKGDVVLSRLQSLLEGSFDLLMRHGIIRKLKVSDLFGAKGNEHPVSHLIRHTDALLKRTKGIYKTLGKQKYFLDLYDGKAIPAESLAMLLGYIFGSAMTMDLKIDLVDFCSEKAYEESTYLFDLPLHRFANPTYDGQVNEAVERYFASRHKWEKDQDSD